MKKRKGLSKKFTDTDNCTGISRGQVVCEKVEEGKGWGWGMVMEGELTLGGEHTIQYTDDVL